MLSVKQERVVHLFLSLSFDTTKVWTQVSRAQSEHSTTRPLRRFRTLYQEGTAPVPEWIKPRITNETKKEAMWETNETMIIIQMIIFFIIILL